MAGERFPLNDPSLPVDPEAATRAIGTALADRHASEGSDLPSLELVGLSVFLVTATAGAGGDVELVDGPMRGRALREIAAAAAEAVAGLPEPHLEPVPVRAGLSLADCTIARDGKVAIAPATHRADRHLDIAAVAVGVADRFGRAVVAPLVDAYGMDDVDLRRLDACQLLVAVATEVGWPDPAGRGA